MSTAPQKPSTYRMPAVELGDVVYWYPDSGANEASPAVVTALGHDNICCNIFSPTLHNCILRDGVRFVSDPNYAKESNEGGRWDYTPATKRLAKLIDDLTAHKGK